MMNRRVFIGGGVAAASLFNPMAAAAQSSDPLSRLTDIGTKRLYVTNPQKFDFVIFMTAQEQEADCGGAFIGTQALMDNVSDPRLIQPVLVMPQLSLQPDPEAQENLSRATRSYAGVGFKILTGGLEEMRSVSSAYGGVFDVQGQKIVGHTLDGILMKKGRSEALIRHVASDYYSYVDLVNQVIENCNNPKNEYLCVG